MNYYNENDPRAAQCTSPREAFLKVCPYCGYENVPAVRSSPAFVDGDLFELDAATLAQLRRAN
jgi:hypothetical protein